MHLKLTVIWPYSCPSGGSTRYSSMPTFLYLLYEVAVSQWTLLTRQPVIWSMFMVACLWYIYIYIYIYAHSLRITLFTYVPLLTKYIGTLTSYSTPQWRLAIVCVSHICKCFHDWCWPTGESVKRWSRLALHCMSGRDILSVTSAYDHDDVFYQMRGVL